MSYTECAQNGANIYAHTVHVVSTSNFWNINYNSASLGHLSRDKKYVSLSSQLETFNIQLC